MDGNSVLTSPRHLSEATGLFDSAYPVLYCDESMTVVDRNRASSRLEGDFSHANMKNYLAPDAVCDVSALLYSFKLSPNDAAYTVAKCRGTKEFSWALVVPRLFFGETFVEFRLFRNRREMLSAFESYDLIFPVKPVVPEYALTGSRYDSENIGRELDAVFEYNMLSNIYHSARTDEGTPELFDFYETVKRIITETMKAFRANSSKWSFYSKTDGKFVFPVVSRKNYINMIALAASVFSDVSSDKKCSAEIVCDEDEATVSFFAKMKKSDVEFVGDFVFPLVGKMFRGVGARASILNFICSLYGVGCSASVKEDGELTLDLKFSRDGYFENYSVKHRKVFDMKGMREAVALISFLTEAE